MTYSGPVEDRPTGAPQQRIVYRTAQAAKAGVSFGSALAIVISWTENHSILWAIVHGILSWLYVVYYAVTR
jgi:hypothetical protein